MGRLHQTEQHLQHTLHKVNKQFNEMLQQHQSDLATLTDSLIQLGQRVDLLATDVATQMQQLTAMVHTLMTHAGIPQHSQAPPDAPVLELGARQLRRNGTGSRSPRRDGDHQVRASATTRHSCDNHATGNEDGIPDLPATFTFDAGV